AISPIPVAVSVLSLTSVNAGPRVCNSRNTVSIMETCYTAFVQSYGIDNPLPMAEFFSGFHAKRTEMLNTMNIDAVTPIKDYGSALTACLAQIENCILDSTYEQQGLGAQKDDGHKYNTDRLITAYQSSDRGYEIQMQQFDCLRACGGSSADVTDKCDADLAAIKNPTCEDYSNNMQCWRRAFTQCCGPDGGEFQCNTIGAEYKIFMKDELATGQCVFAPCA
ncbi:hypothetical protein PMAYCL1PPCAC_09625, partial [Pristionchus mayeri]